MIHFLPLHLPFFNTDPAVDAKAGGDRPGDVPSDMTDYFCKWAMGPDAVENRKLLQDSRIHQWLAAAGKLSGSTDASCIGAGVKGLQQAIEVPPSGGNSRNARGTRREPSCFGQMRLVRWHPWLLPILRRAAGSTTRQRWPALSKRMLRTVHLAYHPTTAAKSLHDRRLVVSLDIRYARPLTSHLCAVP